MWLINGYLKDILNFSMGTKMKNISQLYIFLFKYLSILSFRHVLANMRLTELSNFSHLFLHPDKYICFPKSGFICYYSGDSPYCRRRRVFKN